jgi:FlaA1/EpsC-like NDP-sugar epimerase
LKPRRSKFVRFALRHRRLLRVLTLAIVVVQALVIAFLLRFEFVIPSEKLPVLFEGLLLALIVKPPIFRVLKLDRGGWHNLELTDLKTLFVGNFVASAAFTIAAYMLIGPKFPRSVYCIDLLINFLITTCMLLVIRIVNEPGRPIEKRNAKCILIYGAGDAGRSLLREIQSRPSIGYRVIGYIDDDRDKRGYEFGGVRVLGTGREAASIVNRLRTKGIDIEEIVVAMPTADARQMNEALANCRAAQVCCKTVPALVELLTGRVLAQVRDISCEDLLGREPVQLELEKLRSMTAGQCIMVTGGGGSIGSELCRQVARFDPSTLVVFEQSESDLYRIHGELTEKFPRLRVVPELGTIRSLPRVSQVIQRHRVDIIFHAAAYKHVPMMEIHPLEAAINNVCGTSNVAEAALVNNVRSFVMISTDKAVNPTNVMGLSKRVSELLVASMPKPKMGGGTKFVSVRFGNVLGSNGSVVPLFREQIAKGGPVTVTHPDMKRYFMTIPEAVQLVLEATALGNGGEIFVLEMGEPVKIVDLAKNMIHLSAKDPAEIEIRFTGIRPGEKLFEEISTDREDMLPTPHPKIKIFAGPAPSRQEMILWMNELRRFLENEDREGTIRHMADLVPENQLQPAFQHGHRFQTAHAR